MRIITRTQYGCQEVIYTEYEDQYGMDPVFISFLGRTHKKYFDNAIVVVKQISRIKLTRLHRVL